MADKMSKKEGLGYVMLGVCLDYFLFKPVRILQPIFYIVFGFVMGIVYTAGFEKIVAVVSG